MTPPDSAAGIQDAARHLAEGRAAEAVTLLERLVRDFPTHVTAHVLLAKASEANGHLDTALEAWHAARFLVPGSPLILRERARLLRGEYLPIPNAPENDEGGGSDTAGPEDTQASPAADTSEATLGPEEEAAGPELGKSEGPVIGGNAEAWVSDVEPGAEDRTPSASSRAPEAEADWQIVEETEAPRADTSEPVEPTVAPPVGHRAARAARPSPHDVAQPGRFIDEDDFAPVEDAPTEDGDGAATPEVDDLDSLIHQLENAPRIRPDLDFKDESVEVEESDGSELVSETLARIYETQKQYAEAARAYEQLAAQQPGRATELLSKAAEMRRRADEAGA